MRNTIKTNDSEAGRKMSKKPFVTKEQVEEIVKTYPPALW